MFFDYPVAFLPSMVMSINRSLETFLMCLEKETKVKSSDFKIADEYCASD